MVMHPQGGDLLLLEINWTKYFLCRDSWWEMIFFSFFKTLVGKEIAVELKNDVVMTGILQSVDQFLNIKLSSVSVVDTDRHPQLVSHLLFSKL